MGLFDFFKKLFNKSGEKASEILSQSGLEVKSYGVEAQLGIATVTAAIEKIPVYQINRLNFQDKIIVGHDGRGDLKDIIIKVIDRDGLPISNREVSVHLDNINGDTQDYISGLRLQKSNDEGIIRFSNLKILKRRPRYDFYFTSGEYRSEIHQVEVNIPGSSTNFEDEEFGSDAYKNALIRSIYSKNKGHRVEIDGEEL